jgi:PAS domain S-box-containing protein
LRHNIEVDDSGTPAPADSVEGLRARIRFLEEQLREARVATPPTETVVSSEQARVEAELRHQWRTFDTALSHNLDFNYIFDLQGRFTYVNRALLSLWNKPLKDAVGKDFFDLEYPDELAARLQRQIQQVIDTRQILRDHTPYVGAAGETGYYEYTFVPVIGDAGEVVAVAGSTRDVTDHIRMKEALALSEQKLKDVFSQAPVAIVVFRGPDFVVELANPHYHALLAGKQLVGRPFREIVPELGEDVWAIFRKVYETGEPHIARDWYVPYDQNGDGLVEDVWFNVVYHPMRDADGKINGMVAVCSDVSVQVQARKELEAANRQLEEFAYVASHDLQEPLRTIGIYTELIADQIAPGDAETQLFFGFVRDGVKRMEQLIHDLLAYSQVTQSDASPEVGVADLNEALAEALKMMETSIMETNCTVSAAPLPSVRANASQLAHVFQNLLSNSLKYRRPGVAPVIVISTQRSSRDCIITVQDNGIGFEPQYAQKIFGLFKRLHKNEFPGTGLGLAICQRIVERYGGRMWADGRPGEGATFSISLPSEID